MTAMTTFVRITKRADNGKYIWANSGWGAAGAKIQKDSEAAKYLDSIKDGDRVLMVYYRTNRGTVMCVDLIDKSRFD